MGTGGPFPGGKARPGRDADHSPPSSAEVVNEELYLLSPQAPPWRVEGLPFFTFTYIVNIIKVHMNVPGWKNAQCTTNCLVSNSYIYTSSRS
jgi:hypothetical protein